MEQPVKELKKENGAFDHNVEIKSVSVKNFKNITEGVYNIKPLTEIYGENKTGKTSLLDAIRFAYYGGKNDTEKIQMGKEETEVTLDITKNDIPIKITTKLNRNQKITCIAEAQGVRSKTPRALIKKMLGFGTFNPREMINKEGRKERLLKLIPIYIKKEDLIVPEEGVPFPLSNPGEIDFSQHAFQVLSDAHKDLYNTRQCLNRDRDTFKKSYTERNNQYEQNIITFKQNYNTDPEEVEKSSEEIILSTGRLKEKGAALEQSIKEEQAKGREASETLSSFTQKRDILQKTIEEYKQKLEKSKFELNHAEENLSKAKLNCKASEEKEKQLREEFLRIEPDILKNKNMLTKSRQAERIKEEKQSVEKAKAQFEEKEKEWKIMDVLIKIKWPMLVSKILSPISQKVPGLAIKENGKIEYEKKPIDELSGSEAIELGILLMRVENKSNLILINEFEAMDADSIKKINWKGLNAIVARVAESPIGGNWHSIKMEKPQGGK